MWDTLREVPGEWSFVELRGFADWRESYFESDHAFALFQSYLRRQPDFGDVIPGCAGLRKVRWRDSRRGKGKRSGLRVIYLAIPEIRVIVLVDVYDKDESDDLDSRDKQVATKLAQAIRHELLAQHSSMRNQ